MIGKKTHPANSIITPRDIIISELIGESMARSLKDNLSNPLNDIKKEIQNLGTQRPMGVALDRQIEVTSTVNMVLDYDGGDLNWTSCGITNKGPNPVYIAINEWTDPQVPIAIDEIINYDLGVTGGIKKIYLKCGSPGHTATVNIHAIK